MSRFSEKVLNAVKLVPKGKVASYGQVALMCGIPRAARQVGWILHLYGNDVPWWRIINNAGRISTNCLEHTALMQKEFLEKEGIKVSKKLNIDIEKYRFKPNAETLKRLLLDDEYVFLLIQKYGL